MSVSLTPFPLPSTLSFSRLAIKVSNETQRETISAGLDELSEWIDSDEASALSTTTEMFKAKLAGVRGPADALFHRLAELRGRPDLLKQAESLVARYKSTVKGWATTHPQVRVMFVCDCVFACFVCVCDAPRSALVL